jgi:hypothetical protein
MAQATLEMPGTNKPQVEIVFSDVDGTLLTTDKRIAPSAATLIRRISAGGVPFLPRLHGSHGMLLRGVRSRC